MALYREQHADVLRLRMTSLGGRAARLDVSTYVVRGVMIDTGFHRAREGMDEAVASLPLRGAIVTHWHEDHAGNVALFAERGIPLLLRPDTEAVVRDPEPIQLYRHLVWGTPRPLQASVTRLEVDDFQCVHTPGHSFDHQVVFDTQTGTLFSGDLWLGVRARILHAQEDPYQIVESVRRVLQLEPTRMFDAHRGLVSKPREALRAKAEWLSNTLGEVERAIASGMSDVDIVNHVLGGEERAALVSRGEYARRNLVRAVRRRVQGSETP